MAKDYKNRARKKPEPASKSIGSGISSSLWFIAGLAIGLFVAYLIYGKYSKPQEVAECPPATVQTTSAPAQNTEPVAKKIPYDFYKILPGLKKSYPNEEIEERRKHITDRLGNEYHGPYWLQIGSFASDSDANRLKGRLLLEGHKPLVRKIHVKGTVRFRVYTGPYKDENGARKAQRKLTPTYGESMLLKKAP